MSPGTGFPGSEAPVQYPRRTGRSSPGPDTDRRQGLAAPGGRRALLGEAPVQRPHEEPQLFVQVHALEHEGLGTVRGMGRQLRSGEIEVHAAEGDRVFALFALAVFSPVITARTLSSSGARKLRRSSTQASTTPGSSPSFMLPPACSVAYHSQTKNSAERWGSAGLSLVLTLPPGVWSASPRLGAVVLCVSNRSSSS